MTYDDQSRHSPALRKEDILKLQVLVNKVLRSLTGLHKDTPVAILTEVSGQLSVHQRAALVTVCTIHKAITTEEPNYIFQTLDRRLSLTRNPRHQMNCKNVDYNLSISRGSFFYRGSRLYNQLPQELVVKNKQQEFRKGAKEWIKARIPLLPP